MSQLSVPRSQEWPLSSLPSTHLASYSISSRAHQPSESELAQVAQLSSRVNYPYDRLGSIHLDRNKERENTHEQMPALPSFQALQRSVDQPQLEKSSRGNRRSRHFK
ncbi:hypothetical protein JDV02_009799 [Purpureocillium takamizusanense]|uniref:Uncharacterized protein n=1 Tax=Purpureocillium takamizusanense TaxID=2060973 RepID=A0A9Q8VGK9_9HYPO|nr:uncharacterized protein JDV02_009799 [Purpureocillium takamizusanense]UNI24019.1 hypothetical protein JDV02_009799 [Purpureocillium takamizusanense]